MHQHRLRQSQQQLGEVVEVVEVVEAVEAVAAAEHMDIHLDIILHQIKKYVTANRPLATV